MSYIRKLTKGQEPRPFSKLPSLVPFVNFVTYTDTEVDEAIALLVKANLLRPITYSGNKRSKRFRLTDKQLIQFIHQIRMIETVNFYKTIMKIAFVEKPTDSEKDDISYYFGEHKAGHFIAFLNDQRKKYFKTLTKRKLEDYRRKVTRLCRSIEKMSVSCSKQNQQIIKDELLAELYLPFILTADKA